MISSIETLDINIGLFPDEETLPTLNLHDAQFKTSLERFIVRGSISENYSHIISSFMENVSLEGFNMERV